MWAFLRLLRGYAAVFGSANTGIKLELKLVELPRVRFLRFLKIHLSMREWVRRCNFLIADQRRELQKRIILRPSQAAARQIKGSMANNAVQYFNTRRSKKMGEVGAFSSFSPKT